MQPPPGYHTHRCPCGRAWKHKTECAQASEAARVRMHTCPGCGALVTEVDEVLGYDAGPPPPTFYDYERPRPASVSSGPGFGFYVKGALTVAAIFGVAAVVQNVAETAREVRRITRG